MDRSIGLVGATSIGVGAIVGGGILALAGVAFSATGPSAVIAFTLNGLIALVTAASFAELAAAFPESGGTYTFAKKVLSVEAAFAVGWVVWFASIAAGVLYALGFGYFTALALTEAWQGWWGPLPAWFNVRAAARLLAVAATALYTLRLIRKIGGGAGHWENAGKLVVFAILIAGGVFALTGRSAGAVADSLRPFFSGGALGLFQAMGLTFIALQGFELIAAAGGEIRDPARTIPRAMFLSLGIALVVYIPLLVVLATAGVANGQTIAAMSKQDPEGVVALAARQYLGPFGYWLVLVAAILSMLSALRANLFAASRVTAAMARDRTMPHALSLLHPKRRTPAAAILITAAILTAIVLVVPGVAAAGAASSLIFLVTFALAHGIAILARRRANRPAKFQTPWFPVLPCAGMIACFCLAAYQGVSVPSAGFITSVWMGVGAMLFLGLFARPARVVDASTEALDPEVVRLRGRTPLILVPITNPRNAEPMIAVANALAAPQVGRVLLLSVAVLPKAWKQGDKVLAIRHAQAVLGDTLSISVRGGRFPEALATVAADPWQEIGRVAQEYRCESILLGFTELRPDAMETSLDRVLAAATCDVVVLRARPGWQLSDVGEILVPVSGRSWHDRFRARLLGSLFRTGDRHATYLRVLPEGAPGQAATRARRDLARVVRDEAPGRSRVKVVQCDDVSRAITDHAANCDLVVLGVERTHRRHKTLGRVALRIARDTSCPILMISHRG
jgi:amino acid transporter/nucleotide-binding universal stress UspA family protein